MSVPAAPNSLSFSQIATEFGNVTNKNIGAYRISQSIAGRDWPLDTGIPTSGTIKFSDFRGKTCNVVVDYVGPETTSVGTAVDNYSNNGVVVGGLKSLPSSSETKKVYHIIRRQIGNGLSSGTWDANTVLLAFIITQFGSIYGYGGNGGKGANIDQNAPAPGEANGPTPGGNALAVSYNSTVIVESGGLLIGGGGGGGGGGYGYVGGPDTRSAGGGGGGGQGYPGGSGGPGGDLPQASPRFGGRNAAGGGGSDGSINSAGTGGPGGGPSNWNPARGGDGGVFGSTGNTGETSATNGASGGAAGAAIYHPSIAVSLTNNGGTIIGSTD